MCHGLCALDVDRERRVAAAVRLDARPLRRGDHRARLHLRVGERDPVARARLGEVGELRRRCAAPASGSPRARAGRWSCPRARGSPRRRARPARARAARRPTPPRTRAVLAPSHSTSSSGFQVAPFTVGAERLDQRPERGVTRGHAPGSRARRRSASASSGPGSGSHSPARQSRTSPSGWAISSGVSCSERRRHQVAADAEVRLGELARSARAIRRKASQSVFASHGGGIAWLKVCTNGCRSVVERSSFSYQVAAGSTTSENSAFEVIRKSIVVQQVELAPPAHLAPGDLARPLLGGDSSARTPGSACRAGA